MGRNGRGVLAAVAAALLLAAALGREGWRMDGTGGIGAAQAREAGTIPPIDREAPARVETATFAAG